MRYGVCYLRHDCSDDTVFDEREQVDSKDLQLLKEHEGEREGEGESDGEGEASVGKHHLSQSIFSQNKTIELLDEKMKMDNLLSQMLPAKVCISEFNPNYATRFL